MIKNLLAAAMLAMASVSYAVTPNPLPDGVSVQPEQGLVDVSNNLYPLGVSTISVQFGKVPVVNENASGFICVYVDGSETPAEQLPVSAAYVDNMGAPTGGFRFVNTFSDAGIYTVTIPEGVWMIEETPSPALELNYEIDRPYTTYPLPGAVAEISTINLDFVNAEDVRVKEDAISFFTNDEDYIVKATVGDNGMGGRRVSISVSDAKGNDVISAPGKYTLLLDPSAIEYDYIKEDGTTELRSTNEAVIVYTVTDMPRPGIDPAEGDIDAFRTFTLTMPEGYDLGFVNNMAASFAYALDRNGQKLNNPVCRFVASNEDGKVVLTPVAGNGAALEEPVVNVEPGRYVIVLGEICFGVWNGVNDLLPPFTYTFNVVAPAPDKPFVSGHIYNPDGTPSAGAFITINKSNPDVYIGISADENGYFETYEYPEGVTETLTYSVSAMDSNWSMYYNGNAELSIEGGNELDIYFPAPGYSVYMNVFDENSYTLSGVAVKFNNGIEEVFYSDEYGRVSAGMFTVEQSVGLVATLSKDGYNDAVVSIDFAGEMEANVTVRMSTVVGIDSVEAESAEVRYFNLQGVEVENPAQGSVVIRVCGKEAKKIVVE